LSKLVMVMTNESEAARFKQHTDDAKWLMRNYDLIRTQHGGEYVAVLNHQIIGHDRDLVRLKKNVKDASAVIQYVYKEKPHLIL
jgi:hypothetical protein